MPLPALSKTYSSRVNVPFPDTVSATNNMRSFMFLVKTMLCDQATGGTATGTRNPASVWTVDYSCDGAVAGTAGDGIDRWGTVFNAAVLVQAANGSPHSWCVLRNTASNLYMLLDLNATSGSTGSRIELSQGVAYSGGTTTSGPSPSAVAVAANTNTTSVSSTGVIMSDAATTGVVRFLSCSFSDDGSFRFVAGRSGFNVFTSLFMLHRMVGRVNDPYPWAFITSTATSGRGAGNFSGLSNQLGCNMRSPNGAGVVTSGGINDPTFGSGSYVGTYTTDVLIGEYLTFPMFVASLAPQVAYRGQVPDVYWIGAAPVGASSPSAAAQERVVVGDVIIPMPGPALTI